MAEVLIRDAWKIYPDGTAAVRGVNLEVADREFMVLVGPSGCGKSTLLRMIAGLETITRGTVEIGGRIVNDLAPKDRDIAMVFQNYALYPHMTVKENMAFGLKLRGFQKAEIDERVNEAARILGLADMLERKPRALSGGQRQRVAVGRAIVRKPKVFLFDEPLSNLDAKLRVDMRAELARLHARLQATIIYVTHDQVEAMTLGSRIAIMNRGTLQQVGEPLAVYERPANLFVAGFIGNPPMNFIRGRLRVSDGGLYFDEGSFRVPVPAGRIKPDAGTNSGKPVILGVRPENLVDAPPESQESETISATIEVVEPLGNEQLVYLLTAAGNRLVRRLAPHPPVRVGENMRLSITPQRIHLFDTQTEENLCLAEERTDAAT